MGALADLVGLAIALAALTAGAAVGALWTAGVGLRSLQGLDMHGRQAPVNNSAEDDQLEIPAFLRRQAN